MHERALLLIGASRLQTPSIRWARAAGFHVVVTDRSEDAPGRRFAHEFHRLDGTDVEGQVALATRLQEELGLAGAFASNDFGLPAVAAIGRATGTPAASPEAVARSLDKEEATRTWRAAGLATTTGRAVADDAELDAALAELGPRVVVKPADSSGSRGVRSVADAAAAHAAFAEAREHSPRVLVERVVEGRHVDVNGYFRDGAFLPAGLLDRFFSPPPFCVPTWGTQPDSLGEAERTATYRLVEDGARALGIDVGPVKADVVVDRDGHPCLLEIAPRFHGDVSSSFVSPLCFGKSPVQAWFGVLAGAGGPFDGMPSRPEHCAGWMALLPERPGVLAGVRGLDDARRSPGIAEVALLRGPGHEIESIGDNRAVCGFLWARGADAEDVKRNLDRARGRIELEMETPWPSAA